MNNLKLIPEWMHQVHSCTYPCLFQGIGGLNSLSLAPYNKSYLDNKLSYYIKGSSMVADFSENMLKCSSN